METIFFYASNEELEKASKESNVLAKFCETYMNDGESEDTDETDAEGNIRFKFTEKRRKAPGFSRGDG